VAAAADMTVTHGRNREKAYDVQRSFFYSNSLRPQKKKHFPEVIVYKLPGLPIANALQGGFILVNNRFEK